MKVSREQAAQNRERILDTAARLFRERGFDGIGVADLMKAAGLTHGGFYGHFSSKEDLMAQACAHALAKSIDYWEAAAAKSSDDPLKGIIKSYLSVKHRDHPGQSCVLAALGPDGSRQGPQVRRTLSAGIRTLVDTVAGLIPQRTQAAKRRRALTVFSAMVGALMLSRLADDAELSKEVLDAVTASLTE